jgi:hypothetical protein
MIPYLASFVQDRRSARPPTSEFVHSTIPLFKTTLKGLELRFRHCFRSLKVDLPEYHTLCNTYRFLEVDVLERQSINEVFVNLRSCHDINLNSMGHMMMIEMTSYYLAQ